MRLTLHTVAVLPDGCFSVMLWDGRPFAVSCERTFSNGRPIIKNGIYRCVRSYFNRGGYETFEILVPNHTRVLFHKGNVETDSEGCVLVGRYFGRLDDKIAIINSSGAFAEFMKLTFDHRLDEFETAVIGVLR